MGERATFTCTALAGSNKTGALKPDEDGYYTMVLGALDVFNSAKAFYPFESAKQVFKESSSLMRRIAHGRCKGEVGHPKKVPGQSMPDFINRVLEIRETNVCCLFKDVTIDYTFKDKDGRPVIAVIGKVKPVGPMGPALKAALENPDEDVCFSVRSLTDDEWVAGTLVKHIRTIVTWDWVTEPGIYVASKWLSPALETLSEVVDIEQAYFTATSLGNIRDYVRKSGVGMEDNGNVVSMEEIFEDFGWNKAKSNLPPAARW